MFKDKFNPLKLAEIARKGKEITKEMEIANKEIDQMVVSATSDCGNVKVSCNGRGKIFAVEVNPDACAPNLLPDLNQLITDTIVKGQNEASFIAAERMKRIVDNHDLPQNFNLNI